MALVRNSSALICADFDPDRRIQVERRFDGIGMFNPVLVGLKIGQRHGSGVKRALSGA